MACGGKRTQSLFSHCPRFQRHHCNVLVFHDTITSAQLQRGVFYLQELQMDTYSWTFWSEGKEIHHMEYCSACHNLTSLAQMLSSKGNAVKHPFSHLKNKMKTWDLQLQSSFFQFPRQTAEESLALVKIQNSFISAWIVSFTYLKRWLGLPDSDCPGPGLVSPSPQDNKAKCHCSGNCRALHIPRWEVKWEGLSNGIQSITKKTFP